MKGNEYCAYHTKHIHLHLEPHAHQSKPQLIGFQNNIMNDYQIEFHNQIARATHLKWFALYPLIKCECECGQMNFNVTMIQLKWPTKTKYSDTYLDNKLMGSIETRHILRLMNAHRYAVGCGK